MRVAYVYNDHPQYGTREYREKFRDDEIVIPPMGKVKFDDASEAALFTAQFQPIKKYDNGDPINPKALRTEVYYRCQECGEETAKNEDTLKRHLRDVHAKALVRTVVYKCQACMEEFEDEKSLIAHGIDAHKQIMVDPDAAKKKK